MTLTPSHDEWKNTGKAVEDKKRAEVQQHQVSPAETDGPDLTGTAAGTTYGDALPARRAPPTPSPTERPHPKAQPPEHPVAPAPSGPGATSDPEYTRT